MFFEFIHKFFLKKLRLSIKFLSLHLMYVYIKTWTNIVVEKKYGPNMIIAGRGRGGRGEGQGNTDDLDTLLSRSVVWSNSLIEIIFSMYDLKNPRWDWCWRPSGPSSLDLNKPSEDDTYKTPPRSLQDKRLISRQTSRQKLTLSTKTTISPNVLGRKATLKNKIK